MPRLPPSLEDFNLGLIRDFLSAVKSDLYAQIGSIPLKTLCRNMQIARGPEERLMPINIGLMMFNELFVGTTAVEGQMHIEEGETANFVQDVREIELAVIDSSDPDLDKVVVIPESILLKSMQLKDRKIRHENLPFEVEVVKFLKNSTMRDLKPEDTHFATTGAGVRRFVA